MSLSYTTLRGDVISLADFDAEERNVLGELVSRAALKPDWNEFSNYWPAKVVALYDRRGISRTESIRKQLFRIAQDMDSRLGIEQGKVAPPACRDYRDELASLIRARYRTRRAFCEAAGLSEDLLSHVLAKRKHLSIESLSQALERVGFQLRIVPEVETGDALPEWPHPAEWTSSAPSP